MVSLCNTVNSWPSSEAVVWGHNMMVTALQWLQSLGKWEGGNVTGKVGASFLMLLWSFWQLRHLIYKFLKRDFYFPRDWNILSSLCWIGSGLRCSCLDHNISMRGWTCVSSVDPVEAYLNTLNERSQAQLRAGRSPSTEVLQLQLLSLKLHLAFYLTFFDLFHNLWQVFSTFSSLYYSHQSHMQPIRFRHSLVTIILYRHSTKFSTREGGSYVSLSSGEHADCSSEISQGENHIPELHSKPKSPTCRQHAGFVYIQ